jgi:hypothetical protein
MVIDIDNDVNNTANINVNIDIDNKVGGSGLRY